MSAQSFPRVEEDVLVKIDRDRDYLEITATEEGVYITVDQGGVIATVGPFEELL